MGETIKRNIKSIKIDHKYLFKFPELSEHKNHMDHHVAVGKEPIDKRVVRKVREIVMNGTNSLLPVTDILEEFVKNEINVLDKSRRRFYPTKADIQRIIYTSKLKLRKIKNDQEKIEELIGSLGESNEVYFQASNSDSLKDFNSVSDNSNNMYRKGGLMFVYQSIEMRRLFHLYGHNCVLLDPTFRFCKYSFPLYFLAVQTNVNYQIIAFFIVEQETKEALVEALSVIAHWNPRVSPRYAMTDNAIEEIKALEIVYPEINVFIPLFYCKVSWEQRLLRKDMTHLNREDALEKFMAIANAITEDKTQKAINNLKSQKELKEYFEKLWQKEIKKWALAYKPMDLIFESNEAVDRLHEEFRYSSLLQMKDFTLSEIICQICRHFILESIEIYKTLNLKILSSEKHLNVPFNLLHSPQWVLDIIQEATTLAEQSFTLSHVEYINEGQYSVVCKKTNSKYSVSFSPKYKQVMCTCFYFVRRRVLCKHIIIVGRFYPTWNFEKICVWIFDNPVFKYDSFCTNDQTANDDQNRSLINWKINDKETRVCSAKCTREEKGSSKLKDNCKHYLKSLETLVNNLGPTELEDFHAGLGEFSAKWFSSKDRSGQNRNFLAVGENGDNDIPVSILQKISNCVHTKEKEINGTGRRHRRRKMQKLKRGSFMKTEKEDEDIAMCSIQTFYEEEMELPTKTFTVKLDHSSNGLSDPEIVKECDERREVVIQINNSEAEVLDSTNI